MSKWLLLAATFFVAADCPSFHLANFPEEMVQTVLKPTDISFERIQAIILDLKRQDNTLQDRIRVKLSATPSEIASQPLVVGKAQQEALFDIFSETLKANGIQDPIQIEKLFRALLDEKAKAAWNHRLKCKE